jgi:hypothetical protein
MSPWSRRYLGIRWAFCGEHLTFRQALAFALRGTVERLCQRCETRRRIHYTRKAVV